MQDSGVLADCTGDSGSATPTQHNSGQDSRSSFSFSLSFRLLYQTFLLCQSPIPWGLESPTAELVVFFLFLLTLATSNRGTISLVVCIDSGIVAIVATVETNLTVFLAPRANITHHNPSIAAIAKHLSFSLSFSLTSYIDILPWKLEIARKKSRFLCQETLTQNDTIFCTFGIPFARANIVPKFLAYDLLYAFVVSRYATSTYVDFAGDFLS